jgi:protein CpxP
MFFRTTNGRLIPENGNKVPEKLSNKQSPLKEKKMLKKSVWIIIVLFLASLLFNCADDTARRQRMTPEERAQQLQKALDLTDEQTGQVTKIYTEMREELSKLRQESGGDREAMREAIRDFREKTDARINEILTDEQKEKYQTFQQEQRKEMRDRRDRRPGRE